MANPFNLTIADTSPIFQYYPSQDGPINSSWNTSFSGSSDSTWVPQALGVGTSAHRTMRSGASVSLDWLGTAIYLYGDASVGAYTIELDGTTTNGDPSMPGLLFAKSRLAYASHSLTLHVVQNTSTTSVSSAIITVGMGEAGTIIQNRTIDTTTVPLTSDGMVLSGTWYELRMTYGIGGPFVPRLATNVLGAAISFPISSASAFYIVGHVNFDHGPYHVTFTPPSDLGPARTFAYNGSSHWVGLNTLKFLATGLDRTRTYHVQVTNLANLYYDQSQIVIIDTPPDPSYTSPSSNSKSTSSTLSAGAIAGIAIGAFFFLSILIFLVLLLRKLRSSQTDGDDDMVQHNSSAVVTLPSNILMPMVSLSTPPNAQEWEPNPQYRTTEIRPLVLNSMISQPEWNLPSTPFANSEVSPQYPIRGDLTQEDARFFNNLYALNVPAADIATMMEALRAEREVAAADRMDGSGSSGRIPVEPEVVDTVPPRYDFKDLNLR